MTMLVSNGAGTESIAAAVQDVVPEQVAELDAEVVGEFKKVEKDALENLEKAKEKVQASMKASFESDS